MKREQVILIFIAGHGYGHMSRMRHVIREMDIRSRGRFQMLVVGDFDEAFFRNLKLEHASFLRKRHDVGLVQMDSFTPELKETVHRLNQLRSVQDREIGEILGMLKGKEIAGVLCDTSPMGLVLAEKAGVLGCCVGNFTWVDIYEDLVEIEEALIPHIQALKEEYQRARLCYRLPLHTRMSPFSEDRLKPIPLIAPPPSSMTRQQYAALLGRDPGNWKHTLLISFGGYDFQELPVRAMEEMKDYLFVATRAKGHSIPGNLVLVDTVFGDYTGIIRHSDLIMTKAGYGIITDCLVHRRPILYTDRGRFIEYEVLKNWLDQHFPSGYIPQKELREGNWRPYIENTLAQPRPFPSVSVNGAEILAGDFLSRLSLS